MRWKTLEEWTRERDRLLASAEADAASHAADIRAILGRWDEPFRSLTEQEKKDLGVLTWAHGNATDRVRALRGCLPPEDLLTVEDVLELAMSRADARHVAGKSRVEEPTPINPALISIFEQYRPACPAKAREVRAFVKWAREHNARIGVRDEDWWKGTEP